MARETLEEAVMSEEPETYFYEESPAKQFMWFGIGTAAIAAGCCWVFLGVITIGNQIASFNARRVDVSAARIHMANTDAQIALIQAKSDLAVAAIDTKRQLMQAQADAAANKLIEGSIKDQKVLESNWVPSGSGAPTRSSGSHPLIYCSASPGDFDCN